MALEQKLSLKLAQKLVMTPSLQQAIKLLQMTRMELQGVLAQELVENPILEESTLETSDDERPEEKEDPLDEAAMENIDFEAYFGDYMESSGYASVQEERQAAPIENTLTEAPNLYDYLLWQLHMLDIAPRQRELCELIIGNLNGDGFLVASREELRALAPEEALPNPGEGDPPSQRQAEPGEGGDGGEIQDESPDANLREESDGDREPAEEGAEPFLSTLSTAFGGDFYYTEQELDDALRLVRSFDPPGIACWELPESLLLQLELQRREEKDEGSRLEEVLEEVGGNGASDRLPERAEDEAETGEVPEAAAGSDDGEGEEGAGSEGAVDLDEVPAAELSAYQLACLILRRHWSAFLKRQFPQLAKELGLDLEELRPAVDLIRALDPHPGRRFSSDRPQYIEPDVTIVKVGDEYVIQLNDDGMPRLRISKAYRRMLRKMKAQGNNADAQQYIKDKMRSALWLIKSLDQRQRTIYKVADSLIRQQRGFFDKGIEHLRPMVLRDVAEDIEMHESTVSRVVSNKYIHTPRGVFPLKFFFHSGIDRDYGENISSLTVKRKIQNLIQEEDQKKPLSDSELMRILKRDGIQIARRTVAKYRDELGIPSSTDRKRVFL